MATTTNPVCWLIRRRLGAYQDGELASGTRSRVERHVGRCESCRKELAGLGRLRAALALDLADPPEGVWVAFWPQVRSRIGTASALPDPAWRRVLGTIQGRRHPGLAPALAACALAVVAVVAPWQRDPQEGLTPMPAGQGASGPQSPALDHVVIQSIETEDPDVPVMVYASPESDVTVLWVFGLERTGV